MWIDIHALLLSRLSEPQSARSAKRAEPFSADEADAHLIRSDRDGDKMGDDDRGDDATTHGTGVGANSDEGRSINARESSAGEDAGIATVSNAGEKSGLGAGMPGFGRKRVIGVDVPRGDSLGGRGGSKGPDRRSQFGSVGEQEDNISPQRPQATGSIAAERTAGDGAGVLGMESGRREEISQGRLGERAAFQFETHGRRKVSTGCFCCNDLCFAVVVWVLCARCFERDRHGVTEREIEV